MKTSYTKVSAALALMALSGVAMAGIADTKHNMGGSTNAGNAGKGWNYNNATTEICVFCHTPHGGDSSAPAPLWNRTLSSGAYTTYSSLTSMDAKVSTIGSVSLACLSCHDGTQALNSMLNNPGAGNNALGLGSAALRNAAGEAAFIGGGNTASFVEFTFMSEVPGEPIYLSTDLSNDHPISIQYAGQMIVGLATDPVNARAVGLDIDFKAANTLTLNNGTVVWYVDTDGSGSKTKVDLPLYKRGLADTLPGEALVECATCHDPHTTTTTFLRNTKGNEGSATCLSCHTK